MVHFIVNTGAKKFSVEFIVLHPYHSDRQSYFRGCFKTKPISSTVLDRIKRLGNPSSICALFFSSEVSSWGHPRRCQAQIKYVSQRPINEVERRTL